MATGTDEVVVLAAVAGDPGEQQPPTAVRTKHGALDVVPMPPGVVAALGARIKNLLDAFKQRVGNKPLVRSFVFDALKDDDALVVRIAEDAVQ
jgi:hypothetical protein